MIDALGSGTVTLDGGGTLVDGTTTSTSGTIANAVTVAAGGGTINGQSGQLSGDISGGGPLTFTSSMILSGDNSGFSGTTTVTNGATITAGTTALSATSAYLVSSGATLAASGAHTIGSLADGPGGGGTVNSFLGTGTLTTGADGTSTSFSGLIEDGAALFGGSAALALVKTGAGTFTLSGANTYSGGTTIASGTLDLAATETVSDGKITAAAAGTGAIIYAATGSAKATLALASAAQPAKGALLTPGAAFGNTLTNFNSASDSLDLMGFAFDSDVAYLSTGTSLTVTGGTDGTQTETFALTNGALAYSAQSDGAGGTLITAVPVCFAGGTLIRTARGEVAVEHLAVGEFAVTASGAHRSIRWLGHRTIDCRRHPRPLEVMPIRIAAHAFGTNKPARELLVSPGHSICVDVLDGVLIPASALVNGTTIVQVEVDEVIYWHIELDSHDVLLAENLAAESYLEMGNRSFFTDADVVALAASPDAPGRTHADFCRPFHADGPIVDAVQARLRSRAAAISTGHHRDPASDRIVA